VIEARLPAAARIAEGRCKLTQAKWPLVLHAKRRLLLPAAFADWIVRAADERIVSVLPMDLAVVLEIDRLPASFHGDPADRMIVATARSHHLPIATHDRAIRSSRVATLWRPGVA
jgi:PIN domain nuclease of toxin-antitoxin system